jgi:hypothetical protein
VLLRRTNGSADFEIADLFKSGLLNRRFEDVAVAHQDRFAEAGMPKCCHGAHHARFFALRKGEQGRNAARLIALLAGLPHSVGG